MKIKIHGNDKSFNFALAATKQVGIAPVMEERKKRGCQIPIPALTAIEQVSY